MKQENLVIFVNCKLLTEKAGYNAIRDYLNSKPKIAKYSKITGISNGELMVEAPPMAFKDAHLDDYGLCAYDYQAIYDGYAKFAIENLKQLLGCTA